MSRVRGVLERSLLTSATLKGEMKRHKELAALPNPIKRLAALALHEIALHYPEQIAKIIGMQPPEEAPTLIGSGADSIVYKLGQSAIKVHRASIYASPEKQQRISKQKQYRADLLKDALPDFTLPSVTTITNHPAYNSINVVATTQPYQHDIQNVDLFFRKTSAVDHEQLGLLADKGLTDQLQEFVSASYRLREKTGFMPDMLGRGNIVTTDIENRLFLIDSQPLPSTCANGELLSSRMDNLVLALQDY